MERNTALLEATLQKITDHPELHDQSDYFTQTECGTVACFAGWACMLSNGQPWFSGANRTSAVRFPGDKWSGASRAAMHLLGLSLHEASILFDASNTRRALELMVKDLVNGAELKTCDHYREETKK